MDTTSSSQVVKALCEIQDVSIPIDISKSAKTKMRTWVMIWKHYPVDFEKYLNPLMEKATNFIFNKHAESESFSYLVGFFQFKTPMTHSTLENINYKMMLKNNTMDIIDWRKSTVHVAQLIRILSTSHETKINSYYHKGKNIII